MVGHPKEDIDPAFFRLGYCTLNRPDREDTIVSDPVAKRFVLAGVVERIASDLYRHSWTLASHLQYGSHPLLVLEPVLTRTTSSVWWKVLIFLRRNDDDGEPGGVISLDRELFYQVPTAATQLVPYLE
jgi:hypothetical protein